MGTMKSISFASNQKYFLIDISGRKIELQSQNINYKTRKLLCPNMAAGSYILQIINQNGIANKRIIKTN